MTSAAGFWPSALTPELFSKQSGRLGDIKANTSGVYWVKQLPEEKGRQVIMRWEGTESACMNGPDVSVGNCVNEYGGVSFCLFDETLFFTHKKDLRWYFKRPDEAEIALTPTENVTYADPVITPDGAWLICVREQLSKPVKQDLVAIHTQDGAVHVLCDGSDFYASPRLNEAGTKLAYMTWQLPHMPWEESQLRVCDLEHLTLKNEQVVGAAGFQSQPVWVGEQLYCLSDHEGTGKLYHYHDGALEPVASHWPQEADAAVPMWNIGIQTYAALSNNCFAVIVSIQGIKRLCMIENGVFKELPLPFLALGDHLVAWRDKLIFNAATATTPFALTAYDHQRAHFHTLEEAPPPVLREADISACSPITYSTQDGAEAHAFYYPPKHAEQSLAKGELPPLLVMSHGGPTSATHAGYNNKVQFWTNRGFAVVDVNYRGSTGYGRAYWEALNRRWGEVDVIDCVDAVTYLTQQGLVDPKKIFIRGSSAGGFLTLSALCRYDVFSAAAVYYGIADLTAFLNSTHRFEAGYNDWLVGPYPEAKDVYTERSPINHVASLNAPVIFFHGGEDKVVPAEQSEMMVKALQDKGIPTEYHFYPLEGHGFRQSETMIDTLEKELRFYQRFLKGYD